MKTVGHRLAEFRIAVMLLTRLPAGRLRGDAPALDHTLWAYPFIGLLIGSLFYIIIALGTAIGLHTPIISWLALAGMAMLTGGLHFDGLADFADGIGGGRDKAHCLQIMRDSRIGSYGVIALVATIGVWTTSISTFTHGPTYIHCVFISVTSRFLMTAAAIILPPARSDGLGKMTSGATWAPLLPGGGLILVLICLAPIEFGLTAAVMVCASISLSAIAKHRIGGQTGDVLGAIQLISETAALVTLSALNSVPPT